MPVVGERKSPSMGNFSSDPMYKYAATFCDVQKNIMRENQVDFSFDPVRTLNFEGAKDALKEFYVENSYIGQNTDIEAVEDNKKMMNEAFINDMQLVRENAAAGMNSYNPIIGLSLPMHKWLMMNCVFAQAIPRFVARSSSWTETLETRYMVTPDGKKIDIANQQNQIYQAWKGVNAPIEVPMALPELESIDILDKYFHVSKLSHNLSVATHVCAVMVEDWVPAQGTYVEIETDMSQPGGKKFTEKTEDSGAVHTVWKPFIAEFTPGYGELNRTIIMPVNLVVNTDGAGTTKVIKDTLFATQKDNMFTVQSGGTVKAIKMLAKFDASNRSIKTPTVRWEESSKFVQIPESDGITVPITPEEVKDIGAQYGINQVTKYMSIIKDIFENVKDDDIKEYLDDDFVRLDDDHKLAKTIDFAPPQNYMNSYLTYIQETFMSNLDDFVSGLLTILRDPNMQINIIGRPQLIKKITPTSYTYTAPQSVGPIELDFKKTVVSSDKRVYNFISSEKLWGNDNLIVLLIPKNTNRIIYRIYDYQMYISNEIRDAENPQLPAITAFQRYKIFSYMPLQGRLRIANPTGLREHLPNVDPVGTMYTNNDLGSVYTHWDPKQGKNVPTPNVLP